MLANFLGVGVHDRDSQDNSCSHCFNSVCLCVGGQRSILGVFHSYSLLYFLRQGLSPLVPPFLRESYYVTLASLEFTLYIWNLDRFVYHCLLNAGIKGMLYCTWLFFYGMHWFSYGGWPVSISGTSVFALSALRLQAYATISDLKKINVGSGESNLHPHAYTELFLQPQVLEGI